MFSRNLVLTYLAAAIFFISGCGPKYTYPANQVPDSIEQICRREYKINVVARVVGKTAGALAYIPAIVGSDGQVPKEVHEKMGKVLGVLTRVAMSTDLPIDYCVVVLRDKKHDNQLVVTRSLDDAKRANADMLGWEESINRITYGQEKFDKTQDRRAFVLKDVKFEDFLTDQISQRVRFGFMKDSRDMSPDDAAQSLIVDGSFDDKEDTRNFRFSVIALKADDPDEMILSIFKVVNQVLAAYKFTKFDEIQIQDYMNRQKLVVDKQTLLDYQAKKISDDDLLDSCLSESQSLQEAFKLFGFNVPKDASSGDTDVTAPVTPKPVTP